MRDCALGGVALLERAVNYTLGTVRGLAPAELARPTPCRGWTLADLLAHLTDSVSALREAADDAAVTLCPPPRNPGDAAEATEVARLRTELSGLVGAWVDGPGGGPVDVAGLALAAEVVAGAGAVELAVHGWDVGAARGLTAPIPAALAGELGELAELVVTDADRPRRFGCPLPAPPGAGAAARLLTFLGRAPAWHSRTPGGTGPPGVR